MGILHTAGPDSAGPAAFIWSPGGNRLYWYHASQTAFEKNR